MSLFQKCVTYERQEEELFKKANLGKKILMNVPLKDLDIA